MPTAPSITVHRIDKVSRLFMYDETVQAAIDGEYVVPGNCVLVDLPAYEIGSTWPQWQSDVKVTSPLFGQPGHGHWNVIDDYRKAQLYLTESGSAYQQSAEIEVNGETVTFPGYGPLPAWVTNKARPSSFHNWENGDWVLDAQAELDDAIARKVVELDFACQTYIYDGFSSSALGAAYRYPTKDKDQQNLAASVLDSIVPGLPADWATPFWCKSPAGVWDFVMHSAAQIQQVGRDGKNVILAAQGRNKTLADQAKAITLQQGKAAVDVIVWADPLAS